MKAILRRAVRVVAVVIHDPEVERGAKSLALLVAVRVALALGASAQVVEIVRQLLGA